MTRSNLSELLTNCMVYVVDVAQRCAAGAYKLYAELNPDLADTVGGSPIQFLPLVAPTLAAVIVLMQLSTTTPNLNVTSVLVWFYALSAATLCVHNVTALPMTKVTDLSSQFMMLWLVVMAFFWSSVGISTVASGADNVTMSVFLISNLVATLLMVNCSNFSSVFMSMELASCACAGYLSSSQRVYNAPLTQTYIWASCASSLLMLLALVGFSGASFLNYDTSTMPDNTRSAAGFFLCAGFGVKGGILPYGSWVAKFYSNLSPHQLATYVVVFYPTTLLVVFKLAQLTALMVPTTVVMLYSWLSLLLFVTLSSSTVSVVPDVASVLAINTSLTSYALFILGMG